MFSQEQQPIPGYRLERFLGRGQFGEVWSANGPGGTLVALKFIALQQQTGIRELKSIQAVKRIRHANLCTISAMWLLGYDGAVLDDAEIEKLIDNESVHNQTLAIDVTATLSNPQYLVVSMPMADGSLDHRLQEIDGGIPKQELLDYMLQAARGIDYLNSPRHKVGDEVVGIQHRDIKPANLLFAGDSVLVGDFGVAAAFGEYDTEATSVVGSLCYMSPESIKRIPSQSSDQYALAITYYQLRTNNLPFEPTVSFAELVDIHVGGKLNFERVTEREQKVLRRATATDAKKRYGSCVEFVQSLADEPIAAEVEPAAKFPVIPLAAGSVGLLALAIAMIWVMFFGPANAGPQLQPQTIVFLPEDTLFTADIIPKEQRDVAQVEGKSNAFLELLPTDKVHLTARAENPLYEPIDQEFSFEELVRRDWRVELPPIASRGVIARLNEIYETEGWDAAKAFFASAKKVTPEAVSTAQQSEVKLSGTPVTCSQSGSANCIAVSVATPAGNRIDVVKIDDDEFDQSDITCLPSKNAPHALYVSKNCEYQTGIGDTALDISEVDATAKGFEIDLVKEKSPISFRQLASSAMSPNGKFVAVGSDSGKANFLEFSGSTPPKQCGFSVGFDSRITAVSFSLDSKTFYGIDDQGNLHSDELPDDPDATSVSTSRVSKVDLDGEEVLNLQAVDNNHLLALTDSRLLDITINEGESITKAKELSLTRGFPTVSRRTPDGKFMIYATDDLGRPLTIVDTRSLEVTTLRAPDLSELVEDFVISQDSRWMIFASASGSVSVVDLSSETFMPKLILPSKDQRIKYLRLSPTSKFLITITENGTVTKSDFLQLLFMAISSEA